MNRSSISTDRHVKTLKLLAKLVAVNLAVLALLLVVLELVLGNWIRPLDIDDLKRFSIPVNVKYELDVSELYESDIGPTVVYSRDQWGLRGTHTALKDIDVLTVGGSTTDQKYLDDSRTWQAYAARELARRGRPLVFANAGVDGQSTTGHLFNFRYWFPLLTEMRPKIVLFYLGINDVMKSGRRESYDAKVDATSWRVKSVTWQLIRTVRGNLQARSAQVLHGRKPIFTASDFTTAGALPAEQRTALATSIAESFVDNVDKLRAQAEALGAIPVFVTQTAYAWRASQGDARGLNRPIMIHDRKMNFADVSLLHQTMNRKLLDYCREKKAVCFDLAGDIRFDDSEFYDFLHTAPKGAEKVGRYVAQRLVTAFPDASATARR